MKHSGRHIFVASVLAFTALTATAAGKTAVPDTISVKRAFVEMPVNTLDLLNRSTRLDMLDYFAVDSVYKAENALEGESYLISVKPDYLKLQLTAVSTLELKVVRSKKGGDIVVSVYTISGDSQAPDSDIKFFDSNMKELPRDKYFRLPDLKDFFEIPKGSVTTMKELKQMIPFPTIEYFLSPGSDEIKAKLTVGTFMDKDDYNIMKLFLKPEIFFRWNGSKYSLVK